MTGYVAFSGSDAAGTAMAAPTAGRAARASAPGKLILIGEHSVVYGHPAIAVTVQRRLSVTVAADKHDTPVVAGSRGGRESAVVLTLAGSSPVRVGWQDTLRMGDDGTPANARERYGSAYLAAAALGEARRLVGRPLPVMTADVQSEIPAGHGMGSSAALALAIIAAVARAAGRKVDRVTLEKAAHEVERRQHGSPSGIDAATVLRGGVIRAVPAAERGSPGGMRFHHLAADPGSLSRFRAFDSGCPVHGTGQVVAAVRRRLERNRALERELDRMGELARDFADALVAKDDRAMRDVIRRFEAGLEALGVVPPSVVRLIRRIEAEGGAAKISGAGGLCDGRDGRPGAGMILVYHEEPERIQRWSFLEGLRPVDARLGGPGLEAS